MRYLLAIMLGVLLLAAACTSGNNDSNEQQAPQQQEQEQQQEQVQEQQQAQEPENKVSPGAFADFISKKVQLEYMVTYDAKTQAQGQNFNSEMSMYLKGVDKIRTDVEAQGVETRTIIDGNKIYACNKATGSWMCFETEYETSSSEEMQSDIESNPESYSVTELPDRVIAGANTKCFRVTVEEGNVDYCFSAEGVPLYIKTTGETEGVSFMNEMTATKYSTTVADSAFDLPAEPGNLNDMLGGNLPSGFQMPG